MRSGQQERQIKPGDRVAILGHGIAVVEQVNKEHVHAVLRGGKPACVRASSQAENSEPTHCSFAYSVLACLRTGMSGSASFHTRGNLCRRRAHARGRHPRPARFSPARRWREPRPAAPRLPSSSSRRCRYGQESSETRQQLACLVRLPSTLVRVRTRDKGRNLLWITQSDKRLAEHLEQEQGSFCPTSTVPESLAAKATALMYPAGSVFRSLAPRTRLVLYRLPWQTQVRLRPRRSDSREQVSKPLLLTDGLP
jgi:hypothetical protein